jgi:ribosome assembly protein 4
LPLDEFIIFKALFFAAVFCSAMANDKRTGGIAWAGSLMGSENPNNLGYRYSNPAKRYRKADDDNEEAKLPTNLVVQFQNRQGEELANNLDVPTASSVDDLQALVHSLLEQQDDDDDSANQKIPYSFYAKIEKDGVLDDVEITTTLLDFLKTHEISTEEVLQLTYQPLAVFRVRPVTRCTDTMPGHTEAILHVSYSPDGRHLASGGGDTTVRFWDVNTCLPKYTCKEHKNHVLCTAWSPDGTRFASSDKNGVLILWDPKTGKSLFSKKAHRQYITSISWEPMHLNAGKCERLVTSSKDSTCKLWNVRTQQCLLTMSGHTDSVECVRWGGEGFLYTASRDRSIKVWTAKDGDVLGKLVRSLKGHSHRVNTLALSSDYVCRTGPYDHRGTKFISHEDAYKAAVEKYKAFKDQGPERLVSGSDDFTLFLWHPTSEKHPVKRLTGHQQAVNHIAFSPDGRYFASASFDKKVKLWNGFSGDFLTTLTGHVGAVYQVAWSSDSRFLVSASKDSTAKLWEVPSGKRARATLPGHADEVYALDWSPNGASVATGSKDRTIKIWKH